MNVEFTGAIGKLIDKWPDLVITFLGVLTGGLVTLWIAKWQISKQEATSLRKDKETLKLLFSRLKVELRDNRNTVQQLQETLNYCKDSRIDIWKWAVTIVNSFSFKVYDELTKKGFHKYLPKTIEACIYMSYKTLEGLSNMVKQAIAAHEFFHGYGGGGKKSDILYQNIETYSQTVLEHLQDAVRITYEYDNVLSKQSEKKEPKS